MPADDRPADDAPADARLRRRLIEAIGRDGPLRLDRFMHVCLADPEAGYWQRTASIGAQGDFITAPEISQVFGELVGLWCAVVWQAMGEPAPLRLVELGPGRGTLMRDLLRTLARAAPKLHAAARVHLVETSAPLRATQAQLLGPLSPHAPAWHATVQEVADGPAIVVANEFLDALPIRQLVRAGGAWRERVVDCDAGGNLVFALGAQAADPPDLSAAEGDIAEVREGEDTLLAALASRPGPLAALFVDYGPAQDAFGDTLQAMRRHAYVDPLAQPGASDLTAHVHFAALARKARACGLAADGPITQAEFLGALGHAPRTSRLMAANPREAAAIELAAQRLVAPTGMGSLFKVLCVRTPSLATPPPFT